MATVKVVPRSLTEAYKRREGDFAPNLVGLQFTDGVSLFTFGNFQITTNLDSKLNKNFALGGEWSDYYSQNNLNLTPEASASLTSNDIFIRLNFDINKINRYVYFGSFYEFARVTIEQTIQKWKGSIYLNPTSKTNTPVNTVLSFSYDSGINVSTFLIAKSVISNPYELIVDSNTDYSGLLPDDIFNLSKSYQQYVVWNGTDSFNVIGYTGSTTTNPYLRVTTVGNPFPTLTASTFGQLTYHIKPNTTQVDLFFNQLDDFEKILLNRLTTPIYTSSFNVPQEADGFLVFNEKKLTWPTTDGYNLDINTRDYAVYVEDMLAMASLFDSYKTDLVARRFVSESIHQFDTDGGGDDIYGRKVNKLLRIYGREFDQVKKYVDGISFANVVTYNKLDNTSDELIKIIAKNLGFDVLLTVTTDNFNLLQQIQPSYDTPFSGYSRSLSAKELDIELWRRLVINAWWLYKSKGTRKVIEFFFKLFNIPTCMISLDEYVYIAKDRLDTEEVFNELQKIFELAGFNSENTNLSDYPIDNYGFPRILPETNDNYFQMNGFWYNGGNESTEGNNPHFGVYDYGRSYISQFECFVPDFNSLLTGSSIVTIQENHFNNYNEGTFIFDQTGLPVPYYGTTYADILNDGLVTNAIVSEAGLTYVGGNNSPLYGRPSGDTFSMKLSFTTGTELCEICNYELVYGADGIVYVKGDPNTQLIDQNCCQTYWLPVSPSNPTVVCPNPVDLMISSDLNILGPCIVIDSATNMSVLESCCNKDALGFDVAWDGKNCVDRACVTSSPLSPATASTPTTVGTPIPMVFNASTLFSGPKVGILSSYGCYWCPPDEFVTLVCNVDEYLSLLSPAEVNQLALSLGWDDISNPVTYLNSVLSTFFTTYGCLYLDNLNVPINNQACCELKGGVWTLDSSSRQNYCVQPIVNPCGNNTVNNNHVYVNADGSLTSQECCTTLGYQWVDGNISIIGEPSQQDGVALSFVNSLGLTNYCTACPTQLKSVDDCSTGTCTLIIKDNVTDTNLSQQCCTDYGFIYDSVYNRCLRCASVVNYESSYPYTITNVDTTNLTETCCTGVNGWFGIADVNGVNSLINKCYQCPPIYYYTSPSDTVPVTNTNYTIIGNELLYGGTSLSQTCCNNYNSEVGTVTWDVATQKCLVPAVTPPSPASFQIRTGSLPCHGGLCGAYTSSGVPGPFITVYVPAGQTPATASIIYTNSLLTVILTPPFFEYGGKLYSNIGGHGTVECVLGSGC